MRFGVTLQGVDEPKEFEELVRWIEDLGYDNLWLTDSSLHAGDVYVYAALAARLTSRLVVGTAVTNPLTRHPGVTANTFRTLEQLAPGRIICGIGVGDRPLGELGLPMAKIQTLRDTIGALRDLWAGETLDRNVGPHRFVGARLLSDVAAVPVYVSASGPRALELAGEDADGVILLTGLFPEALSFALEHIRAGRARSSRTSSEVVCFLYGAVDEDDQAALEAARSIAAWFPQTAPAYARMAGMSDALIAEVVATYSGGEFQHAKEAARLIPDELVRKLAFAETPSSAAERISWLAQSDIDSVSIFPLGPRRRKTIEAFAGVMRVTRAA